MADQDNDPDTTETGTDHAGTDQSHGYPADVVAAVRTAQLRLCTQEVPEALEIRLKAASEAKAAGIREWHLAGNRAARPAEAPYLRNQAHAAPEQSGHPKTARGRRKK
jgi:hypothetical protein